MRHLRLLAGILAALGVVFQSAEITYCQADSIKQYHANVVDDSTSGSGCNVTLFADEKAIDHIHIPGDYVVVASKPQIVLYGDDNLVKSNGGQEQSWAVLVGRKFSGATAWRRPVEGVGLPNDIVAGGNTAVVSFKEGTWGIQIYHIKSWPSIYTSRRYEALSISTGRKLWTSNVRETRTPFWTNGAILLTEWLDLSDASIRRVVRKGEAVPIWLQVRSADNLKLLWRKRIPGWLPIYSKEVSAHYDPTSRKLVFSFKSV